MKIRPAKVTDVPVIKKLLYETWAHTYSHFLPLSVLKEVTDEWHDPQSLAEEIQSGSQAWFVGERDNAVVGIVSAKLDKQNTIKLGRLYILPSSQRMGLGLSLLGVVIKTFSRAKIIQLEVEEKNPKGRAFYRRNGFHEVARVRQDLGAIEAYVITMEKRL